MDLDLASVQRSRHFQPNGLSAVHDADMSRSTNQLTQLKPHAGVSCATAQQVGLWLIVPCLSPHYQIPRRNDCQTSLNQAVLGQAASVIASICECAFTIFPDGGNQPRQPSGLLSEPHNQEKYAMPGTEYYYIPPDRQLCLVVPG